MDLKQKSEQLMNLRANIAELEASAKVMIEPLKNQRDALNTEIMAGFKELGTATMRYEFGTFSLAVRKTPKVVDENKVIAWLKKMKLAKEYTAVRLAPQFDALLKESVKEGKQIDGTEISETEYMSITSPKEGDKRKIVTD